MVDSSAGERHVFDELRKASAAFQDDLIGQRLPAWLRDAPADLLPQIGRALASSLACRQRVAALLAQVDGIDDFVVSALEVALDARLGLRINVRRAQFLAGRREPVINEQPVGTHLTQVVDEMQPLLEVVLRNFTHEQAQVGGQPRGNRLVVSRFDGGRLPSAVEFAALCRELDLGAAYQRHLDGVFKPAGGEKVVETQLLDASRYAMLVDAYKARYEQVLDDSELRLLVAMCVEGRLLRLAGDLVVARQLSLLGYEIQQVVVLEVIDQGPLLNTTRRLLMYIPGDPVGAWSVYPSLEKLSRGLGTRLRDKAYQRFFSRVVRRRDSQAFFARVIPVFDDLPLWATYDLNPRLHTYAEPLFNSLAQARILQIKDDAAMVAMPVAMLDRRIQREHDQRLAAEGWALLNVAALFVPGLGLGLLAVTVWQLLGEVYHGIEAWRDGDSQEALDHLTQVATDLALIAATVAGATVAQRLWARSRLVDEMLPAQLQDGSRKLWQLDLTPYRGVVPSAATARDALGIGRLRGQAWVEMDGHHYAVVEQAEPGQWQLVPHDGHAPALRHNGAGAWRLWSEQPAQWHDVHRMFRRLGEPLNALGDDEIDQVLAIHGLNSEHLRALHVYGRAPEPGMLDTVERFRIDQRIRQLISRLRGGEQVDDLTVLQHAQRLPGAAGIADQALAELAWGRRRELFEHVYQALQPTVDAASEQLRRVFPSVHPRAAQALLQAASPADRQRLLESGRVPLALAEAARRSALSIRMARAYEALYLDSPQNADLARVALGMLKHLPGAGEGVHWRLFEGSRDGPLLLSTEEGAQAFDLAHVNGAFQLTNVQGEHRGEPMELFDAMAAAYDDSQREALQIGEPFAHNVRVMLSRVALQRRNEVERLLGPQRQGAFRAPLRLRDGRLGYPLGGCNSGGMGQGARSLTAMVRDIYPSFSDEQVAAWIANLQRTGLQAEAVLASLRQEYRVLRNSLAAWVAEVEGEQVEERRSIRQILINCWRRTITAGEPVLDTENDYRVVLYNTRPGELPQMPAQVSYRHVADLSLLRMELEEIPTSFLLAFPRLRVLDLGGNLLTRLPQPLLQMQHLRQLTLTNNQIVLNLSQAATLASCQNLEYVDLSHNPLGRGFPVNGLPQLRWMSLRNTGIRQLPSGIFDRPRLVYLDLRENRINAIPESFFQMPLQARRRIRLGGNPFSDAAMLRLQAALMAPIEAFDESLLAAQRDHARDVWGDAVGPQHRGVLIAAWETVDQGTPSERFFRVLQQLLQSADFHINAQAMAMRVLSVLQAMATDAELRESLLAVANDEWGCQDGATWCLSNLELNLLVWRARSTANGNQEQSLLNLGRRLWRLDQVDRIAVRDIIERGGNPDESEVGLAYRTGLRDRLNLPVAVGEMSFRPVSGVDEPLLAQAEAAVRAAETQEEIARSMVDRSFWCEYLEQHLPERFTALDRPFQRRVAAVLDDEELSDAQRRAQSDAILAEQRAARRGLLLDMTLKALETGPADPAITVRR